MTTRTQYRAICPACFAQQAVRPNGCLVAHGYTRPQGWHQNHGDCSGTGRRHFGTVEGRTYTESIVTRLRDQAIDHEVEARNVRAGHEKVWGQKVVSEKGVWPKVYVPAIIEHPTDEQRKAYAASLENRAINERATAKEFQSSVDAWVEREPIAVEVEKSTGPLRHWSGGWWRGGKACAGSAMGAQKGYAVKDVTAVTCEKCKALIAKAATK